MIEDTEFPSDETIEFLDARQKKFDRDSVEGSLLDKDNRILSIGRLLFEVSQEGFLTFWPETPIPHGCSPCDVRTLRMPSLGDHRIGDCQQSRGPDCICYMLTLADK